MIPQLREFILLHAVPHEVANMVLSWVEFDYSFRQEQARDQLALMHVPDIFQRMLYSHLHADQLYKVAFLRHMSSNFREDFVIDLFTRMQSVTFPAGYPIAGRACDSDRCTAGESQRAWHGMHLLVLRLVNARLYLT